MSFALKVSQKNDQIEFQEIVNNKELKLFVSCVSNWYLS